MGSEAEHVSEEEQMSEFLTGKKLNFDNDVWAVTGFEESEKL